MPPGPEGLDCTRGSACTQNEVHIWGWLRHANIPRLVDVFEDEKEVQVSFGFGEGTNGLRSACTSQRRPSDSGCCCARRCARAGEDGTVLCGGPPGPMGNLLRGLHVLRPCARCAVCAKHQQSQVTEAAGQAAVAAGCAAAYAATQPSGVRAHAQVVTELAYGGEVFDHLLVNGPCTEDEARSVMRQLVGSPRGARP